jgi:hypothetical protein
MINAKLQSIIDTKSAIGNAIVNKGGTITGETPFFNYAAQIDGISTGTPQTIFAASDGSKWALTNAVNLVNDAGNVTHDFNYWQPANNSTSDPILNIGTVGANISGNIRLVPVNQVNIAQYENIVINDTTGAKYVGYNGYDALTNPTPTGNTTFNRWLLNNSASGTVLFANTTVVSGGTFNGPNTSLNEANMAFNSNTASYGGIIDTIVANNGFVYAAGSANVIRKYHESNLAIVGNTSSYGGEIKDLAINNGFIYAVGFTNRTIQRFNESTLAFVNSSSGYGGDIYSIKINNNFIYIGGWSPNFSTGNIQRFHEGNLSFNGSSSNYGGIIFSLAVNNNFIYVGGSSNQRVQKFHQGNLVYNGATNDYGGLIETITVNNGFIYAGGRTNQTVQKFDESNLAFVSNTVVYEATILDLKANNGFIYAGGGESSLGTNRGVSKFYESNLALVGNTVNYGGIINTVFINNSFIYIGGTSDQRVKKFQEKGLVLDNQTFYTATKIKE